jgi:hypothetical protein
VFVTSMCVGTGQVSIPGCKRILVLIILLYRVSLVSSSMSNRFRPYILVVSLFNRGSVLSITCTVYTVDESMTESPRSAEAPLMLLSRTSPTVACDTVHVRRHEAGLIELRSARPFASQC